MARQQLPQTGPSSGRSRRARHAAHTGASSARTRTLAAAANMTWDRPRQCNRDAALNCQEKRRVAAAALQILRSRGRLSRRNFNALGIAPKAFETIELARRWREDVDDE